MRTYGLSGSGMDVDQMVKDLMKARRASYDKMWQKKTQLEWKKADYNTMYNTLRDFRNTTAFNYKLQSTLMPKVVSSTVESVVSATANADAANVSHSINVTQLAEGAKLTSEGSISVPSASKENLSTQFGLATDTYDIVLKNGASTKTIKVDTSKSIYEFVSSINNSGIGIKASYDATLDRFFMNTTGAGASVGIDFSGTVDTDGLDFINKTLKLADVTTLSTSGQTSSETIGVTNGTDLLSSLGVTSNIVLKLTNGTTTQDITVKSTDSLDMLINNINSAGVNAQAIYDNSDTDNIKFTLKATSGTLSLAGSDQAAFNFLNDKLKLNISQTTPKPVGKDAQFNLDGVNLTQSSNSFTISGVTYQLKAQGSSNVVVSADNDKAIANVKAFIDAYNTTLEKVSSELNEQKYSDYMPLTSEQKADMKDSEITEWEKRSKSGMLRHDSILQDTLYTLRNDIASSVNGLSGKYTNMASIGITTGDYTEGGKLYLDETKLKTALEEDPDVVSKLFSTSGDSTAKQGVAVRFYETLKTSMDKIATVGGYSSTTDDDTESSLAKLISRYNTDLTNLDDRLEDIETRYYKQFDAMEVALSKLNQQSSWLSEQFST
ncbi:flagellar filament capping protein FliD [Desulfosporosinus sp. HMP52]|uniref:flagellar filament capping protein FliD n=1 Tax=Desulfosporosinus sp. HMP52 TaxID=1487923 RepID=UPI0013F4739B|nr:flagellar filament capping protein FliD [Desulfosporosinus sp. HMP52]